MRNWKRFIMFQRYFKPIAKNTYRTSMPIEMLDIEAATFELSFSRCSISALVS